MGEAEVFRLREWVRRHRGPADALIYLLIALAAGALGLTVSGAIVPSVFAAASAWWALIPALTAVALVLVRDRWPIPVLIAAAMVMAVDVFVFGGLVPLIVAVDVLYLATRETEHRRGILAGTVSVVAVMSIAAGWITGDARAAFLVALQLGALAGLGYWYGTAVAQSRELVALHRQQAEDARHEGARQRDAAVQGERDAMARELHDVVAGHVAAMAIRSEAALSMPPDPDADRAALRAVRDSSREAHDTLRTMIAVLRDGGTQIAAPAGVASIDDLAEAARRSGLEVSLENDLAADLSTPVDQAVARIVQESLANCVRHAPGAEVRIRLVEESGEVSVRVDSRGASAPPARLVGNGWGLELLRERAKALGGRLDAGPRADGWCVEARIPAAVSG
ncbi:signal transduction histidine kinase [Microbacterium sp. SORGH_AS428]|uniref:sensor histidine kinase n=1 Tax=Microbacterium sp. SORGH_AS_0428 TaxID=3041788 RepID=UPI00285FF5C7|nr:histidine kinase [Microbacterium sp. SORGH_AS_0428]MDR6199941.1 signal transduction histidine kinase [Microbacterium sp. SORGH_AS_0428]